MSVFRKLKPAGTVIISLQLFSIRHRVGERGVEGKVCVLRSILPKENSIRYSQEVHYMESARIAFRHHTACVEQ